MTGLLAVLGILLIGMALLDALWTTLWVNGAAGPLAGRVSRWIWLGVRAVVPAGRHHLLSLSGPFALIATLGIWILLLWTGWVLVFSANSGSLVHPSSQEPANLAGRIYFVGYAIFTMGNGDFTPQGSIWQLATALTTGSGMLLVTLAITYFLSIVSAVVNQRSAASQISALGITSEDIVITAWNGQDFGMLNHQLLSIAASLGRVAEQHLAYPILHAYHANSRQEAAAPAIGVFDDALTLLEAAVTPANRPDPTALAAARFAVSSYLSSLKSAGIQPAAEPPPPPHLHRLSEAGIPIQSEPEIKTRFAELGDRRRQWLGLSRYSAW